MFSNANWFINKIKLPTGPTEKELVTWSFDVLDENYDRQLVEKELNVSFIHFYISRHVP